MRIPKLTPASNVASDDILLLEQKTTATSGTLVVGNWYLISTLESGDNFTNVGYISAGVWFKATATTPTTWTNSTAVVSYTSKSVTPQQLSGGGAKRFLCSATQTSTNAPTMDILVNSLGGTPVWSYDSVGYYYLTLTGAFAGRRAVRIGNEFGSDDYAISFTSDNTDNQINVFTAALNNLGVGKNGVLVSTSIEILIYP